jgi:hypothetical protein
LFMGNIAIIVGFLEEDIKTVYLLSFIFLTMI